MLLDWIAILVSGVAIGVIIMNNREALESLRQEVESNTAVVTSAVSLITGLSSRLDEALEGDDLAGDIENLRDELDTSSTSLATAVAANTRSSAEVGGAADAGVATDTQFGGDVAEDGISSASEDTGTTDNEAVADDSEEQPE